MKKLALSITALAVILAVSFTSCKKEDTGAPVVTIKGAALITLDLGDTYQELGATATDEEDGDITPVATGTVNPDQVGEYIITYKATDEAGNEGTATRKVQVTAEKIAGSYSVVETDQAGGTFTYTQVVAFSQQGYNKLVFTGFGGYGASSTTIGSVSGNTIALAEVTFTTSAPDPAGSNRVYDISGTIVKVNTFYNVATMSYKAVFTPTGGVPQAVTTTTQAYSIVR